MPYQPLDEQPLLELESVNSLYHFRFASGYVFPGEQHPYWEMVYVLSGQVDIGADDKTYMLGKGDVIFHRPDEFHSIWANYAHTADIVVTSFRCNSPAMRFFERRRTRATPAQQAILACLLEEGRLALSDSLESHHLQLNPERPGGAYTIRLILTHLLMNMLHSGASAPDRTTAPFREPDEATAQLIARVTRYMRDHLQGDLSFSDLCRMMGMSATSVKQLFHHYFETTPMAYYEQLRMNEARQRLQKPGSTVASVALSLGFSSPAYFSTRFHRATGMTPRQYRRSAPVRLPDD